MSLTRMRLTAAVGAVCLLGLTGCGAGSGDTAGSNASVAGSAPDMAAAGKAEPQGSATLHSQALSAADQPAGSAAGAGLIQQQVIKTGAVSITTKDPQQARDQVDGLLTTLHGRLDDEQTIYDKQGRIHDSQLVLRVPVGSFETAMNDLEGLGTVVHSSSTGKDVTSQVIDVQQRLRTLRISLRDLNSFQQHAATIGQLLRYENAITQRRGEYQSLKAQRNQLLSQTTLSTIDFDISVPAAATSPRGRTHEAGFVTGLRHGWAAFTGTVLVVLTAVGALLPFAILLAAVGLPVWWWVRRRSAPVPATPEAAAAE
jgi:hypothetical protein